MESILIIGLGGFIGAVLRYGLSGYVQALSGSIYFPYGTLAVNLLGCFVIGFLSQLVESHGLLGPKTRSFLLIGLLGSFTTFSTFGNESLNLLLDGDNFFSLANISIHILLGLGFVWLGRIAASAVGR